MHIFRTLHHLLQFHNFFELKALEVVHSTLAAFAVVSLQPYFADGNTDLSTQAYKMARLVRSNDLYMRYPACLSIFASRDTATIPAMPPHSSGCTARAFSH